MSDAPVVDLQALAGIAERPWSEQVVVFTELHDRLAGALAELDA